MKLVSWNIQWCLGIDGRVDPKRIVDEARALADFDVLCLQEVAANFPALKGSRGEDHSLGSWTCERSNTSLLSSSTAISAARLDPCACHNQPSVGRFRPSRSNFRHPYF